MASRCGVTRVIYVYIERLLPLALAFSRRLPGQHDGGGGEQIFGRCARAHRLFYSDGIHQFIPFQTGQVFPIRHSIRCHALIK